MAAAMGRDDWLAELLTCLAIKGCCDTKMVVRSRQSAFRDF